MKNREARRIRYLGFDRPHQLGNLASELARIRRSLWAGDEADSEVAISSVETCQYFTEWTITTLNPMQSESDLRLAEELLRLGRQLTGWKHHWDSVWHDENKRLEVATIVEQWSGNLLEQSGLLQPEQS